MSCVYMLCDICHVWNVWRYVTSVTCERYMWHMSYKKSSYCVAWQKGYCMIILYCCCHSRNSLCECMTPIVLQVWWINVVTHKMHHVLNECNMVTWTLQKYVRACVSLFKTHTHVLHILIKQQEEEVVCIDDSHDVVAALACFIHFVARSALWH